MPASRGRCSSGTSFDENPSWRFARCACDLLFLVAATEWRRACACVGENMRVVIRISLPVNLLSLGILSICVCGCGQSTDSGTNSGAATGSGGGAGGGGGTARSTPCPSTMVSEVRRRP
jgi:hypothetical protein